MTESNDPPTPQQPPDEPSPSPFPESSLGSPDPSDPGLWAGQEPQPPAEEQPASPPPWSPPPAGEPPVEPQNWAPPASTPPLPGGLSGGDPLGGAAFPSGYTSPPPPGAGGPSQGLQPAMPGGFAPAMPATGAYVLSGWWRRVGATAIDTLIIGIIAAIITTPLGLSAFAVSDDSSTGALGILAAFVVGLLLFAVIAMAYAPVMMSKTNGKTVGRMATGIRVIRTDGQPITLGFAALREIAVKALLIGGVGGTITFGLASLLDVLWPLWDDENRALHDMIVNTRTVRD